MKLIRTLFVGALLAVAPLRADDATDSNTKPADATTGTPGWKVKTGAGAFGGAGGFGVTTGTNTFKINGNNFSVGAGTIIPDRPAIITTQAIDAQAQTQLKEDLSVMDKLLRDETNGVAGNDGPRAMGIMLKMVGAHAPMYVESCGAIFTASTNLALAAGDGTAKKDDKPVDPESPWERAKSELQITNSGGNISVVTSWQNNTPAAKFEQAKVDALVGAIMKILPEASHIRALKPDESVIVTISGSDDSGKPARLTIKARKSDIDDAAGGKIKPEEFKQRVGQRIG